MGKNLLTYALKEPTISGLFSATLVRKNCTNSSAAFKLGNVMKMWEHKFEKANVPEASRSIELIISHVFNCDPNVSMELFRAQIRFTDTNGFSFGCSRHC